MFRVPFVLQRQGSVPVSLTGPSSPPDSPHLASRGVCWFLDIYCTSVVVVFPIAFCPWESGWFSAFFLLFRLLLMSSSSADPYLEHLVEKTKALSWEMSPPPSWRDPVEAEQASGQVLLGKVISGQLLLSL